MLPYHTDGASRYPSKLWCASLLFLIAHWRLQNGPLLYCTLNLITIIFHLLFSFTLRSVTSLTVAVLSCSKLTHYCFLKERSLLANASQIHLAKSAQDLDLQIACTTVALLGFQSCNSPRTTKFWRLLSSLKLTECSMSELSAVSCLVQ